MMRIHFLIIFLLWGFLSVVEASFQKPNVIFILADDMGWGDLSSHGHPYFKTPHLDKLASQGIDIHQFYVAASICSPSRAGFLTGQFPMRYGIHSPFYLETNIKGNQSDWLDPKAPSVARIFKEAGYYTGICGKWHLVEEFKGRMLDAPKPSDFGFDEWHLMRGPWEADLDKDFNHQVYPTATKFIRDNKHRPFYLTVTLHETHVPYLPSKESLNAASGLDPMIQKYAASVADLDRGIGQILEALKEGRIEGNTLIIFSSDNGPAKAKNDPEDKNGERFNAGSTGGRRGWKGQVYEGGIHQPFIARWPGHIPEGKVDQESVMAAVDYLPTVCKAVGIQIPSDYFGDGESRLDVLFGNPKPRTKPLFWYGGGQYAVRDGQWKYVTGNNQEPDELFDIVVDPNETSNVANKNRALSERLKKMVTEWKGTHPVTPNPECLSKSRNDLPRS